MIHYNGSIEHDLLVASWYTVVAAQGDLDLLFTKQGQTLGDILAFFRQGIDLSLVLDAQGAAVVAWFRPFYSGALASLWVRRDRRQSRLALYWFGRLFGSALDRYACILGVTKQPELLDPHRKVGYTVLTILEKTCDGADAWLVLLDRLKFEQGPAWQLVLRWSQH